MDFHADHVITSTAEYRPTTKISVRLSIGSPRSMTTDLLTAIGQALYGRQWITPLAADLGRSSRTLRYWRADRPMPDTLTRDLLAVVEQRIAALQLIVNRWRETP